MDTYFLFLIVLITPVLTSHIRPMSDARWREFKLQFGKFYDNEADEIERYMVWRDNLKNFLEHNKDESKTFRLGINNFTDLTHPEFREQMGGCYKIPKDAMLNNDTLKKSEASTFMIPSHVDIPGAVDWRNEGYVTPIKNQGQCGSCYTFSTTGALEGQIFRKTGKLPDLSEQNLIDCTTSYGNQGCHGGWMDNNFRYIRDNGGIDGETGYPYYARELGYCYYRSDYKAATDSGFVDIPSGDENALMYAVATVGPISVAIDATHPSFMSYHSGVYVEPYCGSGLANLDHAVLVVGYGTENGQDYWLVKNSWGTYWGDQGYIKMARNRANQCGIATKASYPLV